MSDWLREVEHAGYSYSVQYAGPDSERSTLLAHRNSTNYVRTFWVFFLTFLFCLGVGIGAYLIIIENLDYPVTKPYILISRHGWRATPPLSPQLLFPAQVSHVALTQTSTDGCDVSTDCARIIRDIQHYHVHQQNLTDIAYNFLVAGDGATYEGRGWKGIPEVGLEEERARTLVVALLGNFDSVMPPNNQIEEFKVLLKEAVKRDVLDPCFTISLYKQQQRPQDGGGQLVHVFNRLVKENNKRKSQIKCS